MEKPNNLLKVLKDPKADYSLMYAFREAVRIILLDSNNSKIAIQHVGNSDIYKLPGGGFEVGETISAALEREIHEEVGAVASIKSSVGMIIEIKSGNNHAPPEIQHNYCFSGQISGKLGNLQLDEKEIERNCSLVWLKPKDALEKMVYKSENLNDYVPRNISIRDSIFLRHYLVSWP